MIAIITLISALLLAQPSLAFADGLEFDPHVDLRLTEQMYPDNISPVVNQFFEIGNLQLPTEVRYGSMLSFKMRPEFQVNPASDSIPERYWAELPEGYFQIKPLAGDPTLRIQLGFNTFTWGVTDGYNPLDVVSAARYEDPLNPEKLGAASLAVHAELPGGVLSFDGIYIPRQRQSILPGNNSRWLPREQFQSESVNSQNYLATIVLPSNEQFGLSSDQVLSNALDSNFGFKMDAHLPSLDLSAMFFDGAAPLPATDVSLSGGGTFTSINTITINADPFIGIRPVYYRQIMTGGSLVYALGEFIIRGEAALTRVVSKRSDLPSLSNEYVGEIEHTFPIEAGTLTALVEGTYAQHSETVDPTLVSLSRVFDRAVAVGAHYSPNSSLTAGMLALLDTEFHGELIRLEISDALSDSFKLSGTGELLQGADGSPVGTYRYNSRALVSLKYAL
jgi:hypothetical protein